MTTRIERPSVSGDLRDLFRRIRILEAVKPTGGGGGSGTRIIELKILDDSSVTTVGNGKVIFMIPSELNGMVLIEAAAFVTTVAASVTTIQIRNVTDAVDMLSTPITIDGTENTSYTAATPPVIDTANDDVATGDLIAVDVDVAGTTSKGLGVVLTFDVP